VDPSWKIGSGFSPFQHRPTVSSGMPSQRSPGIHGDRVSAKPEQGQIRKGIAIGIRAGPFDLRKELRLGEPPDLFGASTILARHPDPGPKHGRSTNQVIHGEMLKGVPEVEVYAGGDEHEAMSLIPMPLHSLNGLGKISGTQHPIVELSEETLPVRFRN